MRSPCSITTADGSFNAFIATPSVTPAPAIVVLHEVFGVNDDMRASCHELAAQGFVAVCPDLFWRQLPGVDLDHHSQKDWEKGLELYEAFDLTLGAADVAATMKQVAGLPECTGRVGVMGYCLGGLLTYLTSARFTVDAAVAYYGGSTEQHLHEAAHLAAPMLMHLAGSDEFMSKDAQAQIRAALDVKPNVEIHTYQDQRHAFARHTGQHYDAASARLANGRTIEFFRRHLRGSK